MVRIREILCPSDFSEASRHALAHAAVIARWFEARVTGLHVMPTPIAAPPPMLAALAEATPVVWSYQTAEEELRGWLMPATNAGLRTRWLVSEGNVVHAILEQARSGGADLIVMGTHGLSGFERFLLGSVTEKVLRKAPCPVLTVPPTAETAARVPYTRLLCPVDFSESSLAALQMALSFAKEADAALTILHVFDWPADEDRIVERFDAAEFRRVVEADAQQHLASLVDDEARTWCKPSTAVASGKPYRRILEAAAHDTDLIVMGVHGRNPLNRALFGSTTNQVVRHAACPVLTVRG